MADTASPDNVLPAADLQAPSQHDDDSSSLSSVSLSSIGNIEEESALLNSTGLLNNRAAEFDFDLKHAPGPDNDVQETVKTNGHLSTAPNGDGIGHVDGDQDERPAKRQRTRESTPSPGAERKIKHESPPWKKVSAEGPTSYTENGRRKSGRINTLPLELQPPTNKRVTRRAMKPVQSSTRRQQGPVSQIKAQRASSGAYKPGTVTNGSHTRSSSRSTPKSATKLSSTDPRKSSRSLRRRTPPPPPPPSRQPARSRRPSRYSDSYESNERTTPRQSSRFAHQDGTGRSPRIRLRVGRSGTIPLVHPGQVRKRSKIGTSFDDFWQRAGEIPVEEGGLLASEDGPLYNMEMAQRDAKLMMRIEKEAEPGGVLSRQRCSLFAPEPEEEPLRQWARHDHMTKAVANFRRLLLSEQQRHRSAAKKLAEACRDEWFRRQPKSAEQLEAEQRERWFFRYRLVVRAMFGTWDNVRAQVNRRRLEAWEAEEQRRVKAALNEAVTLSEQKLQARRAGLDSEMPTDDEDGFDDLSDDAASLNDGDDSDLPSDENSEDDDGDGDEDSDDMSSSEDDEADEIKDLGDEGLTQDQLREKYANIPTLEHSPDAEQRSEAEALGDGSELAGVTDETSDESIDMDDDLGSMEEEDYSGSGSEEEESESEADAGGLLGLFFAKSELKQMKVEAGDEGMQATEDDSALADASPSVVQPSEEGAGAEVEMDDEDAVSLIRHPESVNEDLAETAEPDDQDTQEPAKSLMSELSPAHTSQVGEPNGSLSIQDEASGSATLESSRKAEPTHDGSALPQPTNTLSALSEKPASPETDPFTNTPGHEGSASPPTSETKPSEVDTTSLGGTALTKVGGSRSATPHSQATHKTEIPFLLRGTLREYQHDGLDWLSGLYANNTNGILADEMGLGKTIQTIALLAHLACVHGVWGPHLVVVPTSVMLNWEMEFKKWCPGFKILAYYGSQDERKRKRQGWNNDDVWNVCVTSYQLVLQDQQVFKRRRWHYLILDEAHNIKNFKSQRWQTLLGFNTHSRLLLTGTPLQNNLTELWSLLFFLMPAENGVGGFADLQEFHDWFQKPESQILESGREQMDEEARAIISKLHKVLRPYLLRRLKKDVEKQMPGKYEHVEFCRLSKRQRELYDGFLSRADTKHTLASGNYMSIINCLMQLRKVCNHPDLFVDRPIMTSFRMQQSVASDYGVIEHRIRGSLLAEKAMSVVNLSFLNLMPTRHEHLSSLHTDRIAQLSSHRMLMDLRETQKARAQRAYTTLDPSTVSSNIAYVESAARWGRFEELQHCVYLNALRRQQRPIYGKNVIDLVSIGAAKRPYRPRPRIPQKIMSWFEEESHLIGALTPSLDQRADGFKTTIEKFSFVTPAVVTRDLEQFVFGRRGIEAFQDEDLKLSAPVRWAPFLPKEPPLDPWHEARMRLSIQFPDKRLLQFDCGKLQILDKLLRKLQAGQHRALIFTQMTKVLDILEKFLNIHGHKYLRLDGATKVEQRQILTDRFNHDPRILCFILSTRSGGLGINLTGADTVIFYDQDWNPAMDKQCQDRCHRIGQTRDVHIYRLVSEHTIEANILRKASQKQMLDDVVIQEGDFTTDYFNKVSVRDVLTEKVDFTSEGVAAADAALDRVLGGPEKQNDQRTVGRVLEQAEDREDVAAARVAEREIQADDDDFTEKPSHTASGTSTARQGTPAGKPILDGGILDVTDVAVDENEEQNAWGSKMGTVDDYMLGLMAELLKGTKLELPKDKKKGKKKGKDTRKR